MKVVLLKDWGDNKKGAELEILDNSVLKKGIETNLFKEIKKEK
jgi:hypothetical protein